MLVYRTETRYGLLRRKALRNDVGGRSFCDFCGKQLNWYENIPIVSWLILGGKSRCCQKKLPVQYPIVELLTGVLFVMSGNYLGMAIITLLVFGAVFDLKHMILPDFSTYILIAISIIFFHNWWSGVGACLFLLVLHLLTKGKGMGMGDVKLALFMGLFLGWPKIILAFYVAFISGAIVGVGLVLAKKLKRGSRIPFGPFLILATILTYFYGDKLLYYLYRWF